MEQTTCFCPKCGNPMTVSGDTGETVCLSCNEKYQIIGGELRAQIAPNPAFTEERVQAQKAQWKKQLIAGAFVPVIWALTCILSYVLGVSSGLFLSSSALIGALISLPVLLYACGVFQQQTLPERFGKIALALVILLFGLFAMDFVCRLILDYQMVHEAMPLG